MDYFEHVDLVEHDAFNQFNQWAKDQNRRTILMSTAAKQSIYEFDFKPDDILMVGRESSGVDLDHAEQCGHMVRIPMQPELRSLNVAISASVAITEAIRQTDQFESLT